MTGSSSSALATDTQAAIVNCHTHLELGWMADLCPQDGGQPFTSWIGGLIARRRQVRLSGAEETLSRRAIDEGIEALQAAGTTHVGDISQTGLSIEPLLDSDLAGVVYLEVIGLDREKGLASFEWARLLLEKYRAKEKHGLRIGLSPHAPYSTHADVFQVVSDYCRREEVPMCVHVAESPHENEALLEGSGPFFELAGRVGVPQPHVPRKTSITYLSSLGVLEARPLLIHMVHVSDEELDLVADAGAKVAHCPRSNMLLQCGRMPLERMLARGISVALGTDSLGSSPSLDVTEEAVAASFWHDDLIPEEQIMSLLANAEVLG